MTLTNDESITLVHQMRQGADAERAIQEPAEPLFRFVAARAVTDDEEVGRITRRMLQELFTHCARRRPPGSFRAALIASTESTGRGTALRLDSSQLGVAERPAQQFSLECAHIRAGRLADTVLIPEIAPLILGVVSRKLGRRQDVDDVVQDVLIKVIQVIKVRNDTDSFNSIDSFNPYVHGIAINVCNDYFSRQFHTFDGKRVSETLRFIAESRSPAADFARQQMSKDPSKALARTFAKVVRWAIEEPDQEWDADEIARLQKSLGQSVGLPRIEATDGKDSPDTHALDLHLDEACLDHVLVVEDDFPVLAAWRADDSPDVAAISVAAGMSLPVTFHQLMLAVWQVPANCRELLEIRDPFRVAGEDQAVEWLTDYLEDLDWGTAASKTPWTARPCARLVVLRELFDLQFEEIARHLERNEGMRWKEPTEAVTQKLQHMRMGWKAKNGWHAPIPAVKKYCDDIDQLKDTYGEWR
jgi:DNA-directed RNA polymerase specialized sigma24 family protein